MEIVIGLSGIALAVALFAFVGRFGFLIARRAGFPGWVGAIIALPLADFVAVPVVACRRWPDRAGLVQGGS